MKDLSYLQKTKLPYSLLLDPETRRAAAYTSRHALITEEASAKLVNYALAHTHNTAPFDSELHADGKSMDRRPLPPWATPEVLERCVVLWIERPDADASEEEWHAIPRK